MKHSPLSLLATLGFLLAVSCGETPAEVCVGEDQCAVDETCVNGTCNPRTVVDGGRDAGLPADSGVDSRLDSSMDSARDSATSDASTDDSSLPCDAMSGPDCSCGDGVCDEATENTMSCSADCTCGDSLCHSADETRTSCSEDCGPTFDQLDWLVQDRVRSNPRMDPYCVPYSERDEQGAFDPIHFVLLDHAGRQNFTSFQVRAFHDQSRWTDRAITTFDFPPYFERQRLSTGMLGAYGGDTMESEGRLVSIVGTNDSNGTTGWFNNTGGHDCSYGDAWVLYDKDNVPISPGDGEVNWSDELRTPIRGVSAPSTGNCPNAGGTSRTRWTYYPQFSYSAPSACTDEPHKRIDTIIADHGPGNLSHHEVFYLSDEYGFTRWERWNCSATRQMEAPSPDYAALRCNYAESESAMHMSYPVPEAPEPRLANSQSRGSLLCAHGLPRRVSVGADGGASRLDTGWVDARRPGLFRGQSSSGR